MEECYIYNFTKSYLQLTILLKVTFLQEYFLRYLNSTIGTNSRKMSQTNSV